MSSLINRSPKNSYKELLTLSDSAGLTDTLSFVGDGKGGVSPLALSTTKISLNGMQWPTTATTAKQYLRVNAANTQLEWATLDVSAPVPYDIGGSITGKPAASAIVLSFVAVRNFVIPANMTGSIAKVTNVGAAACVFSLRKDGVEFGKMSFAIGGATATFTAATQTTVAPGNIISVVAPAAADSTFANCVFTILATLT